MADALFFVAGYAIGLASVALGTYLQRRAADARLDAEVRRILSRSGGER